MCPLVLLLPLCSSSRAPLPTLLPQGRTSLALLQGHPSLCPAYIAAPGPLPGLTIFVFNALTVFSGQPIYNDFYMACYNVVFTALAPLVVGWFDRDLDKAYGMRFPLLYKEGQNNLYFK